MFIVFILVFRYLPSINICCSSLKRNQPYFVFFSLTIETQKQGESEREKFVVYLSYFHIVLSFNVSLQWHKTNKPDDKIKIKQATHHTTKSKPLHCWNLQPIAFHSNYIHENKTKNSSNFCEQKNHYKMKLRCEWKCIKRQTLRDHCIV